MGPGKNFSSFFEKHPLKMPPKSPYSEEGNYKSIRLPGKRDNDMKHALNIRVSKKPVNGGIVACRNVSVREKLLRFLFGDKTKLTVIVPGDTVEELAISEIRTEAARETV